LIAFWVLLVCGAGMAIAQDAYPGAAVYHDGWYNALDVALLVLAVWQLRSLRGTRAFQALSIAAFGGAIVVFAGAASGLMGPDTHTVIGAPGATVRDDDAGGSFKFPLTGQSVEFSTGSGSTAIDGGRRYSGAFVFWQQPRTVLQVNAGDARGNHLTITQPTNASFLSPVLLLEQHTTIDGMDVAFDSFSVPAVSRNVKAVLFNQQQAAQLHTDPPITGGPAILFAVADSHDRVLKDGIGIVPAGASKVIGGLTLSASVTSYPAIVVASAPYWPVLALGAIVLVAGFGRSAMMRERAAE
jgi:hypothetical protein